MQNKNLAYVRIYFTKFLIYCDETLRNIKKNNATSDLFYLFMYTIFKEVNTFS